MSMIIYVCQLLRCACEIGLIATLLTPQDICRLAFASMTFSDEWFDYSYRMCPDRNQFRIRSNYTHSSHAITTRALLQIPLWWTNGLESAKANPSHTSYIGR